MDSVWRGRGSLSHSPRGGSGRQRVAGAQELASLTHLALGREAPAPNTILNSAHVHGVRAAVRRSPEGHARTPRVSYFQGWKATGTVVLTVSCAFLIMRMYPGVIYRSKRGV